MLGIGEKVIWDVGEKIVKVIWEKAIESLVAKVGQSVVDTWRLNSAVDRDISDLDSALLDARRLIERSECWRLPKYKPIDDLLPQLKDAVYEAESVVNEFKYQGLKNEIEKSSLGTTTLLDLMNKFPAAVKEAIDNLDNIHKKMIDTCDRHGIPENPNKFSETARPRTTRCLETTNTTEVCGRNMEFNEVLSRMGVPRSGQRRRSKKLKIGEGSDRANKKGNVSILSIVGMGGVGKTTLAQMVCNDKCVKSYFDLIMWVCVSDNFDLEGLTKEIIESATGRYCNLTNSDTMERNLANTLNSKRFLLVLDDVWSRDWQRCLGPMKVVSEGSIVMVTTRSHKCVEVAGTRIYSRGVINLEGLEKNIYWKFFKSCAFVSGTNSENYAELEVIGKEICGRLKGSPLAAKTMGGLLRTCMDATHWMNIKESKMWQLKQEERDILPILQLSYQYLPSHLKKCFSYCALYPKDFKFTKWELTKLWIMQGFINLPQQLEVYWKEPSISEAEGYFRDLIQRCFFQKAAGSSSDKYVIHDLMHDMCQSITKDECFCIENEDLKKGINHPNYKYISHLSVFQKGIKLKEQKKLCKYEKLFSVRVGPRSSCCITAIDYWCKELNNICSLSLSRCKIKKLHESIGNLKHLQYLDISFTPIEMLPESFCKLYSLVYLNMEGSSNIESLPEGFNNLVNLRFLYWPGDKCFLLLGFMEINAKEIAEKIEAEFLKFSVSHDKKIEILKYMNKLSGRLFIESLENVPNKEAADEAHLKNKSLVRDLCLSWGEIYPGEFFYPSERLLVDERRDEVVFQGLCPHPNLKVLRIYVYGGRTLSSWFKKDFLPNLTEIHIVACNRLTNLQDSLEPNHFTMLKVIKIKWLKGLVSLPVESFGGFVFLEELAICYCPKLTCSKDMVLPPSIKYLELDSCGEVEKSISSCLQNLTSLETLMIRYCSDLISIPAEVMSNLKSLNMLHIHGCAKLQSLGGLKFLTSLDHLTFINCPDLLVSISAEEASNLKSLKRLFICDCERLQSLGGLKFLASVEDLSIKGCPKITETDGQNIEDRRGRLISKLLAELPSTSRGPETL